MARLQEKKPDFADGPGPGRTHCPNCRGGSCAECKGTGAVAVERLTREELALVRDWAVSTYPDTDIISVRMRTLRKLLAAAERDIERSGMTRTPGVYGGEPCVPGTRFPVAQLVAELAEGETVASIAEDMGQDAGRLADALRAVAVELRESRVTEKEPPVATSDKQEDRLRKMSDWASSNFERFVVAYLREERNR